MESLPEIAVDIHAFCFDDQLAELVAELEDEEEYIEPYDWPEWTDEDRWTLCPEDIPYQPTPEDWADYGRYLAEIEARREFEGAMEYLDCVEAREDADRFTDRDLIAAGLPVG